MLSLIPALVTLAVETTTRLAKLSAVMLGAGALVGWAVGRSR